MWGPSSEVNGTINVIDPKNAVVGSITVGIDPYAIAYDSLNKDMYVANFGSDTLSVINSLTNTVIATIPVGTNPSGVAYDPDNGNIYVSNVIPNNVSVIDGSTNTMIGTIPVGNNPYGIAYRLEQLFPEFFTGVTRRLTNSNDESNSELQFTTTTYGSQLQIKETFKLEVLQSNVTEIIYTTSINIANDPVVESIVYTHIANILYSLLMLETGYVNGVMEKQENIK